MRMFMSSLLTMFSGATFAAPIDVQVAFIEALDPTDTTSSERFRKEYELAIQYGIELTAKEVADCGYKIKSSTSFYGASDPLQAKERAEQSVKAGAWLVVGPRRSNHYILAAKGSGAIPTVSLMASSDEVSTLGPRHLSLVAPNSVMAEVAANESLAQIPPKSDRSYISVVRDDCLFCKGFADQFETAAKAIGLQNKTKVSILSDEPDLKETIAAIELHKPAFVLLPNYSVVTGYLIEKLHKKYPEIFFVGGDGWGTNFGFVENGRNIGDAKGFTVRGNPPVDVGLKSFPTGQKLLSDSGRVPVSSAAALSLLKIIDSTKNLLCKHKPKTLNEFADAYEKSGKQLYAAPWGVSFYELSSGNISYKKSARAF
jgi:hypothetical protein